MIVKVQERTVRAASVAVHCTAVVPIGNGEPDARSHATWIGAMPPEAGGVGKVTDTAEPVNDVVVMFGGQVIVSGGGIDVVVVVAGIVDVVDVVVVVVVGVGEFGEEHAHVAARQTSTTRIAGRRPLIRQATAI